MGLFPACSHRLLPKPAIEQALQQRSSRLSPGVQNGSTMLFVTTSCGYFFPLAPFCFSVKCAWRTYPLNCPWTQHGYPKPYCFFAGSITKFFFRDVTPATQLMITLRKRLGVISLLIHYAIASNVFFLTGSCDLSI